MKRRLAKADPVVFTIVAGLAGFSAYFSMYAFRKPFTAATFTHVAGWNFALDYKIALVIAQALGYALAKLLGVKIISELPPSRRAAAILILIGAAWVSLIAFALVPAPWNVAALFFDGLPLGLIWGLVFGYMEGRRVSEVLGAILCASFIVSSGVVKSVGAWLLTVTPMGPFWMPAATGAVFLPLLLVSVWTLGLLPPPSAQDEAQRVRRKPMTAPERSAFLAAYAPGLVLLVLAYVLLTAFRDVRDNFAAEIWISLGYRHPAGIFSASEIPVAALSLVALAAVMLVRDNLRALMVIHAIVFAGFALLGGSTLAFQAHLLAPLPWMILAGAGLYMAYTPFNAMLFDRRIAYSGRVATAGFLIYVADASGYVGSVTLLLWRNVGGLKWDWLQFFTEIAYATSLIGVILTAVAAFYFWQRAAPYGSSGRSRSRPSIQVSAG